MEEKNNNIMTSSLGLQPTRVKMRCVKNEVIKDSRLLRERVRLQQVDGGFESGLNFHSLDLTLARNEGEPELVPVGSFVEIEIKGID